MFNSLAQIVAQFTRPQKILALILLLLTIVIISIAPSLIDAITLNKTELTAQITELRSNQDSLQRRICINQEECTDNILQREDEFVKILDILKKDIQCLNEHDEIRALVKSNGDNGSTATGTADTTQKLTPIIRNKRTLVPIDRQAIITKIDRAKDRFQKK